MPMSDTLVSDARFLAGCPFVSAAVDRGLDADFVLSQLGYFVEEQQMYKVDPSEKYQVAVSEFLDFIHIALQCSGLSGDRNLTTLAEMKEALHVCGISHATIHRLTDGLDTEPETLNALLSGTPEHWMLVYWEAARPITITEEDSPLPDAPKNLREWKEHQLGKGVEAEASWLRDNVMNDKEPPGYFKYLFLFKGCDRERINVLTIGGFNEQRVLSAEGDFSPRFALSVTNDYRCALGYLQLYKRLGKSVGMVCVRIPADELIRQDSRMFDSPSDVWKQFVYYNRGLCRKHALHGRAL